MNLKIRFLLVSALILFACYVNAQNLNGNVDTLTVQVSDLALHSVLSTPDEENTPVALIIPGSGPTDLNGNQSQMNNNSLKYLSEALVKNKIATLRFDKRGVAKSAYSTLKEDSLTIEIYANDVVAIIEYLQAHGYENIYVIGHSEGSLIGLIALQDINVSGFISVGGAGNSADVILKKQLEPKLPKTYFESVVQIIDSLKNGHLVKNVPAQLGALFRPSVQPYLISWFKYNPVSLIRNLKTRALVVQGSKDIQIDTNEGQLLAGEREQVDYVEIENMNHIFKTIEGGMQENIESYTDPSLEVNERFIEAIVNFINTENP
ncbi:alpha/beta hydrolase [Salinivirga cyanobacteriivorans]